MKIVFGGTFDPVHIGHLQMATELKALLSVGCVHLMPCFQAVHKHSVSATAQQRLKMIDISIQGSTTLAVDDREIRRGKPSFTIDSMREIRKESGGQSLCFGMGADAAKDVSRWREADKFCGLSHIIVLNRPGYATDVAQTNLRELGYKKAKSLADLKQSPNGYYILVSLSEIEVSSTLIRQRVNEKADIASLVTGAVAQYICDNGLYQQ